MRTDTSFTPAHPAGRRRQLNRLGARFDERPAEATHQRERKHGLAAAAGQRIPTPANSSRPYRNFLAPDRYRSFLPLQSLSNPSLSAPAAPAPALRSGDRKSTRLNSSHANISYAVFCLKKKK